MLMEVCSQQCWLGPAALCTLLLSIPNLIYIPMLKNYVWVKRKLYLKISYGMDLSSLIFGFGLFLQHSCGDAAVDGLVSFETFSSWAARKVCFVLG